MQLFLREKIIKTYRYNFAILIAVIISSGKQALTFI